MRHAPLAQEELKTVGDAAQTYIPLTVSQTAMNDFRHELDLSDCVYVTFFSAGARQKQLQPTQYHRRPRARGAAGLAAVAATRNHSQRPVELWRASSRCEALSVASDAISEAIARICST